MRLALFVMRWTTLLIQAGAVSAVSPDQRSAWWPPASLWDTFWPTLGLVIVGAWAACVAIKTLRVIARQTEAAEKAADAAKKSADALMDIERPWLLVTTAEHYGEFIPGDQEGREGPRKQRIAAYWTFKNVGKTPAFVTEVAGGLAIISNAAKELPEEPPYRIPHDFAADLVYAPEQESHRVKVILSRLHTQEEWSDLTLGKSQLVLFGVIRYKDPFERSHESRFCYAYEFRTRPLGFSRVYGPSRYNHYS